MTTTDNNKTLAAIDLGSNSFHMIVANVVDGNISVLDRIKESVRMAAGLDKNRNITPEASERALECLKQFGQRINGLPEDAVSAVGTNTLRRAKNSAAFLVEARKALGYDIETITGLEEARLVYLGVAHSMAGADGTRLVVDIGGGSTEVILGEQFDTLYRESLHMGCVSMSQAFFSDGKLSKSAMRRARYEARQELRSIRGFYKSHGWNTAIGASGTIKAIGKVSEAMGWSDSGITPKSLKKIRRAMLDAGHIDKLQLKGLSDRRRPVFAGGVMVLSAVFDALDVEQMLVSDGALREGLLYDQVGRIHHADVRDNSINAFSERFSVDRSHVERVRKTAYKLYDFCADEWGIRDEEKRHLLSWAAEVHEAGLAISHNQYHKHGAYLVEYSDLAGFTREQQKALAVLVRLHRRKFSDKMFDGLTGDCSDGLKYLAVLFRVAVLLHRSRIDREFRGLRVTAGPDKLTLEFPDGWLDKHPLNKAGLKEEKQYLAGADIKLEFS
jgi:exopolyphosphatase/guanosine-5'-triphosphate,3'-diphosphate pyrophosphatase